MHGKGSYIGVHPACEGGPALSIPPGDVVRRQAARAREVPAGEESRTTSIVEDGEGADWMAHATERRPGRAIPLRNVARVDPTCAGEAPSGMQGGTLAVVEHREGKHVAVHPVAKK
jgi:hypothetical protein